MKTLVISPTYNEIKNINEFIKRELDNFLHQNPNVSESLLNRITQSERERKDMAGIKKLAKQRAKKANLHNKKLRDCKVHLSDEKADEETRLNSTIFITEGDSASGSITKSRNVYTQISYIEFNLKKLYIYTLFQALRTLLFKFEVLLELSL